jgi:hypothetical protein
MNRNQSNRLRHEIECIERFVSLADQNTNVTKLRRHSDLTDHNHNDVFVVVCISYISRPVLFSRSQEYPRPHKIVMNTPSVIVLPVSGDATQQPDRKTTESKPKSTIKTPSP